MVGVVRFLFFLWVAGLKDVFAWGCMRGWFLCCWSVALFGVFFVLWCLCCGVCVVCVVVVSLVVVVGCCWYGLLYRNNETPQNMVVVCVACLSFGVVCVFVILLVVCVWGCFLWCWGVVLFVV